MIFQNLIDEIEGISILLGYKVTPESTTALEKMKRKDLIDYRDSLALDFEVTTGKKILTIEE